MTKGFTLNQHVLNGSGMCYAYRFNQATGMLEECLRDYRDLPRHSRSSFLSEARMAIIRRLRKLRSSWAWRIPFAPAISSRAAATWREIGYLQNILLAMDTVNNADALSLASFVEPHHSRTFVQGTFLPVGARIWLLHLVPGETPVLMKHMVWAYRPTDFQIIDYEIRPPSLDGEFDRLRFPSDAIQEDGTIHLPSRSRQVELFWKRAPAHARMTRLLARPGDPAPL